MPPSQGVPRHFQVSRFLELLKTSQFAWFAGHLVALASAFLYLVTFRGGSSGAHNTFYRVLYLGVIESFGIIIYQQHFKRGTPAAGASSAGPRPPVLQLILRDDNALYVALAFMWLLTPRLSLTMFPYVVFSFFHFLTYLKSVILPQVFEIGAKSRLVMAIDKFVRENSDRSMVWSSFSELVCLALVLMRALLWYPKSWITAIVYCLFIKIRYETSPYMKSGVKKWEVRLDGLVSHPQVPAALKNGYVLFKNNIRELRKYNLSGTAPPKSM
ncbi:nucleoporin POM33 [Lachancea thermotolerans CBS 6340]|uniref:KLTH0H08470p n=1 Tax=Lachancea thermotolerans (strain ATCC 56472 / CBS 6340 / NRRL Y-8284) TaxID=559295 RepID=C5E2X2_LACTC|nr:KLTH0H08470p [Lachancea thermotolerans CBS 6340]CAR30383.1 KLTH0H08470p [Lachancea thermotolerans CBS 6340]